MAKREPKQIAPCSHDVAQWRSVGPEHKLRCCRCQETLEREFGGAPRVLGVMLFRNVRDGGYAPFNPKGWLMQ
jgi:hypothetical protein